MQRTETVLVVGAGPTGLTAAMELARHGVKVRIVDKLPKASDTSRALAVQSRTLELLERRALSEEMLRLGNKAKLATIYGRGKTLGHQEFSRVASKYNFILMLSQAETERILTEELARQGTVVERSVEMVAFSRMGDDTGDASIRAVLRKADGSLEEVDAAYMIAAEGAHSSARHTLGMKFEGETLSQKFMLGDLHVESTLPDSEMSMFLGDTGFLALFPMGNRRFRMMASEVPNTTRDHEPSLAELQAAYDKNSHIPARLYDMVWSSHFAINSRMLHHLREGRVFFGGDSAHVHSPAGGQGMNTGIQDMIDLGWKIAMVLKGQAAPELLDTYAADRIPVIRGILKTTETMTAGISNDHKLVHEAVTRVLPLALDTDFVQDRLTGTLSQTRINYRESPLSANHDVPGSLRAGDRVPECQVQLRSGPTDTNESVATVDAQELVDSVRLTLLFSDATQAENLSRVLQPWAEVLTVRPIAMPSDQKSKQAFEDIFGAKGALLVVRPDSYVGFAGNGQSLDQLVEWLTKWFPRHN